MRLPDLFRTTAFRWIASLTLAFTGLSLLIFAFVYWQTAGHERAQVDRMLEHEAWLIAEDPAGAEAALATWLREDLHNVRYGLIVGRNGLRAAGNMPALPDGLQPGGGPRDVVTEGRDGDDDDRAEVIRAVATRLGDGRVLALGNDTDELDHTTAVVLRALALGLAPMLALSLGTALLLGWRAASRVATLDKAMRAVRGGGLSGRLPVSRSGDEFDRMAAGVNAMLDEIGRLVAEIQVVGDSIAHDLRTPLTRARTRLEGARDRVTTATEYRAAIDEALGWLDQTFDMITAVLRIGEIEHGRRRAAFAAVRLAPLLGEAAELYAPVAEEKGLSLRLDIEAEAATVLGDRDLIFEAVANLVDNAVKFTPACGSVLLSLRRRDDHIVLAVSDDGPGIEPAHRADVLRRFFRVERSRHAVGNGLGLALVKAIAALHDFELEIGDNHPGCHIALRCPGLEAAGLGRSSCAAAG